MEPTFFKCASGNKSSELDIASGFNGDAESARFALERHWDEWITEADFSYLQKIGKPFQLFSVPLKARDLIPSLALSSRCQHYPTAHRLLVARPRLHPGHSLRDVRLRLRQLVASCRPRHQLGGQVRTRCSR